jgi:hypothetical protein
MTPSDLGLADRSLRLSPNDRAAFFPFGETRRHALLAFLNQCDITGGNSGSPVMNAKGELIGAVFDGNYEAMISDWQYDCVLQPAISVDMRYVLFITSKFGHAGYLLEEMGVAQ